MTSITIEAKGNTDYIIVQERDDVLVSVTYVVLLVNKRIYDLLRHFVEKHFENTNVTVVSGERKGCPSVLNTTRVSKGTIISLGLI